MMVDFEPKPIVDVVCENFVEYSKHGNANFVVQKCLRHCEVRDLETMFTLFLKHKDDILATQPGGKDKCTLDSSLRAAGRTKQASVLQDGTLAKR